ncbi:MAG: acyltransferase family protein, partial [Synechococcaceae cyanobacterium ELA182]
TTAGSSPSAAPLAKSPYRPEIDGLRAFAVIAVIINHFNKDLLPSGYLGVDIFFVISGYVITSSLANHRSESFGDFFLGFYARRVKRLVPALVVFVLFTSLLLCFFNPEPGISLGVGRRALFGASNINLFRASTDYFATSTELNPFTHTWSLGVEEQFYILFPLLIWFTGFGRIASNGARNLFLTTLCLSALSLTGFIYLYQFNEPAAYFLMPARIWELGAGCLLFMGLQHPSTFLRHLEKLNPLLITLAMAGALFIPRESGLVATIVIVTLSLLLIASLQAGRQGYSLFTQRWIVYIGLISYSLYLWHWGVLCISRWTIGIHWWSWPFQLALMLALAIGSYRYVETPLRRAEWSTFRWKTVGYGAGLISLGLAATLPIGKQYISSKLYLGNLKLSQALNTISTAEGTAVANEGCSWFHERRPRTETAMNQCTISAELRNRGKRIFLLGDSHTRTLMAWASDRSKGGRRYVRILHVDAQPAPTIDLAYTNNSQIWKEDAKQQDRLISLTLSEMRNGDSLILANYLLLYFGTNHSIPWAQSSDPIKNRRSWSNKLEAILQKSKKVGANVILMMPTPDFVANKSPTNYVTPNCSPEWFRPQTPKECYLRADRHTKQAEALTIKSWLINKSKKYDNFHIYEPFDVLCPSSQKYCSNYIGKQKVLYDDNHVNMTGARLIAKDFEKFMSKNSL